MSRSVVIAAVVLVAAVGWVLSGQIGQDANSAPPPDAAAAATPEGRAADVQSVRVTPLPARPMTGEIVLQGRTEPSRTVEVRAEARGRVAETPAPKGALVAEGQVLARLAPEDRPARVEEAKALVAQRTLEHEAALSLNRRGHATDVQLAEARARLDAARAMLARAEIELENTVIRAPFDGVLDTRAVEVGAFVEAGGAVATVVDLDPIRMVGFATERAVPALRRGEPAAARIVGGLELEGAITYVSPTADPATRTFRVEAEAPNPAQRVAAGLTAQLRLPTEQRLAHLIPPSALSLADDGTIGIKTVEEGDRVAFRPVEILRSARDGVWIAGAGEPLPPELRLITVGHEYVAAGNRVTPVEAPPIALSAGGPS